MPTGNLVILSPAGAQQGYTNSPNVSIQLTAEDSFSVTHYLIHLDNASTPLETQFISIGSHQVFNHSDSSFNIGSIEGTRTIYAWAKDSTLSLIHI